MTRLALGLWLLFTFVSWNAIFDWYVDSSVWEYLRLESAHFLGRGRPVTIPGTVGAGVARGAVVASAAAGAIGLIGLAAIGASAGNHRAAGPPRSKGQVA